MLGLLIVEQKVNERDLPSSNDEFVGSYHRCTRGASV
jgi:hypothetical protein